jgi:hypothetical protein
MKKRVLFIALVAALLATAAGAAPVAPEGTLTGLMGWWQAVAEWLIPADEPTTASAEGGGPSTQRCGDCEMGPSVDPDG